MTELSYGAIGATAPACEVWTLAPAGFRRFESTTVIGQGGDVWAFAADELLRWGIKRRSGFHVNPSTVVTEGADYTITARLALFDVHEPVRVITVVDEPHRCGFAYGTVHGHPVSGEEAFIVHRNNSGTVFLTMRSLTRPAPDGLWRAAFPALLVAQRVVRHRYLRALVQ